MSTPRSPHEPSAPTSVRHRRSHSWLMVACCIPMLIIAVALVATKVVDAGFLLVAIACVAMMALMMRGMGHGGR